MDKLNKRKFDNKLKIFASEGQVSIEYSMIIVNAIKARKDGKKLDEYVCKYGKNNIILFLNCELAEEFFENSDSIKDWLCPICIEKRELEEKKLSCIMMK